MHSLVFGIKRFRKKREASRRRQRREAKARRLEERRAEEEARRRKALETDAANWEKSRQILRYIEAVQAEASQSVLAGEQREALRAWVAWAEARADRLDPISQGAVSVVKGPDAGLQL
jgi:hypothetical protein